MPGLFLVSLGRSQVVALGLQPTELSHRLLVLLLWVALCPAFPSRECTGCQDTSGSGTSSQAKGSPRYWPHIIVTSSSCDSKSSSKRKRPMSWLEGSTQGHRQTDRGRMNGCGLRWDRTTKSGNTSLGRAHQVPPLGSGQLLHKRTRCLGLPQGHG